MKLVEYHKTVKASKPSKYRNQRIVVNGVLFASKREAKRYGELLLLVKAGEVRDLRLQVPFDLIVRDIKVCRYVADFVYTTPTGRTVVEDVKGMRTPVYELKKRLMFACLGIGILEV